MITQSGTIKSRLSIPDTDTTSDAILTAAKLFRVFRVFRGLPSPSPRLIVLRCTRPAPACHRPFSPGSVRCALARELVSANLRKHVSPL